MDIYTVTFTTTFFVVLITLVDVKTNCLVSEDNKNKIYVVCIFIFVAALCEYIGKEINGEDAKYIWLHRAAKLIEFCVSPCIGVAAANAYGIMKKKKFMIDLLIAQALFELVVLPFRYVFWIDEKNIYHREPFYWVYVSVFVITMLYCYVCIIAGNRRYRAKSGFVTLLILLFLSVGIGIQMVYRYMTIDFMYVSVGSFFLYHHYGNVINQIDVTTRLLNRRCFKRKMENIKSPACVIFFDVNNFKKINDTFGHAEGDICLANVADKMLSVYGRSGQCYRIGGDEFCTVLHKNLDNINNLNREFGNSVKELCTRYGDIFGVSLGYAFYDKSKSDINYVIKKADDMMYENKGHR